MADTVVPQEYGTTLAEKRSVGIKVCSSLLEKIRFDLHIARTDNKTDMRYMINMDYSADLPINTMGRRIRTRLYFTSESHLHTLINVLRFAFNGDSCSGHDCTSPVLSPYGMNLLNQSKEVCYLTQIVIRLFEDTSRKFDDPRRFRVEILFSAGATATPIHQARSTKETDLTRLDTEPLQAVGRDGLTCSEIEDFFYTIITERGKSDGNHDVDAISDPGAPKPPKTPKTPNSPTTPKMMCGSSLKNKSKHAADSSKSKTSPLRSMESPIESHPEQSESATTKAPELPGISNDANASAPCLSPKRSVQISDRAESNDVTVSAKEKGTDKGVVGSKDQGESNGEGENDNSNKEESARFHKYFYLSIATGTLLLGAGCLVMAMGLTGRNRRGHYNSRR